MLKLSEGGTRNPCACPDGLIVPHSLYDGKANKTRNFPKRLTLEIRRIGEDGRTHVSGVDFTRPEKNLDNGSTELMLQGQPEMTKMVDMCSTCC